MGTRGKVAGKATISWDRNEGKDSLERIVSWNRNDGKGSGESNNKLQ
jgi:hypothetical protein